MGEKMKLSLAVPGSLFCQTTGFVTSLAIVTGLHILSSPIAIAQSELPIADVHLHYSHDSVELTPPERVIEIMRSANLKFALVSSSDDNGTQLLNKLAPDLIVPGLRPYRRRGETGSWFKDEGALEYVERLLAKNRYASIGEFHLYGENADLEIPRRIVELADEHNLILQAHSDAEAVERLLAQSNTVKVIWAHSGFADPEEIASVLAKHDRLWADLAYRSDVGGGGTLNPGWRELFEAFPDRLMLGTDTYTPERMYFIPEHAENARSWLETLPSDLAENIAWKNGFDLIMPVWKQNENAGQTASRPSPDDCDAAQAENAFQLTGEQSNKFSAWLQASDKIEVSKSTSLLVTLCGDISSVESIMLDASMPAHGHGTNYEPTITALEASDGVAQYQVDGLVMHMPGNWRWEMLVLGKDGRESLMTDFGLE